MNRVRIRCGTYGQESWLDGFTVSDFDPAKLLAGAIAEHRLGYAVVCATKPEIGALKDQPDVRP